MPCYALRENGKTVGHICGDLGEHCSDCGAVAEYLCDYPVGDGKTCDRLVCEEHAHQVGVDLHYCATHKKRWDKFRRKGLDVKELENVTPFKGV